jgi:hypothetical protein
LAGNLVDSGPLIPLESIAREAPMSGMSDRVWRKRS